MSAQSIVAQSQIWILLTQGFDDAQVSTILAALQELGQTVNIISPRYGLVEGLYGLQIEPHLNLSDLPMLMPEQILIIPGASTCVQTLLADPRTHRLLRALLIKQGRILTMMGSIRPMLFNVGLLNPTNQHQLKQIVMDRDASTKNFLQHYFELAEGIKRISLA